MKSGICARFDEISNSDLEYAGTLIVLNRFLHECAIEIKNPAKKGLNSCETPF